MELNKPGLVAELLKEHGDVNVRNETTGQALLHTAALAGREQNSNTSLGYIFRGENPEQNHQKENYDKSRIIAIKPWGRNKYKMNDFDVIIILDLSAGFFRLFCCGFSAQLLVFFFIFLVFTSSENCFDRQEYKPTL